MSHTPVNPVKRLDYDHRLFVDREKALALVLNKAQRVALRKKVEHRVIIFRGQRGSGKTWLLQEIENWAQDNDLRVCFFVLPKTFQVEAIRATTDGLSRPLLLLLDVDGARDDLLDALADGILAPLAQADDVLIVLAERGRGHYWLVPEFREKSEEMELGPFELEEIRLQVALQVPDSSVEPEQLRGQGGGFPWSNYILACYPPGDSTALDSCADIFLEEDHGDLRPHFTALSVLRAFDETRMVPLLQAYREDWQAQEWGYRTCRELRQRLVDTTLARWSAAARGFVIDEPFRSVLEAWLCVKEPEQWCILHRAAHDLYERWVKEYSQSSSWWVAERDYHKRCLDQMGYLWPAPSARESQGKGGGNGR